MPDDPTRPDSPRSLAREPEPYPFVPYRPERLSPERMRARAEEFYARMDQRRSVRHFSADPVPRALIELAIRTASTAPSGAHRQPWTFVAVSDPGIKREIRLAAEAEERETYARRMSDEWREALRPLGTDASKPYLELVPWIVVAFEQRHGVDDDGGKIKHFYVKESVGLACGLFIAAVHTMGLVTLTHTPSPMGFLTKILGRPEHERPFILFPVGYPAADARVPDLQRKSLDEVSAWDPPRGDAARDR
ncbi:MAG: nitroreductase family protein [Myxococcales bacterium]|nr:nitroreductase family protein [Myxococcales bacterium]